MPDLHITQAERDFLRALALASSHPSNIHDPIGEAARAVLAQPVADPGDPANCPHCDYQHAPGTKCPTPTTPHKPERDAVELIERVSAQMFSEYDNDDRLPGTDHGSDVLRWSKDLRRALALLEGRTGEGAGA